MESARTVNFIVTDWLSRRLSGRRMALAQGAQRFAALLSSESELEVARPAVADESGTPATLKVETGLHTGACLKLTAGRYLIGSAPDCDIVLRDRYIAEHHCKLTRGWAGFSVRDLRSKSGKLIAPADVKYDGGSIEAHYEVGGLRFVLCQAPPSSIFRSAASAESLPGPRTLLITLIVGVLVAAICWTAIERARNRDMTARAQQNSAPSNALDAKRGAHLIEQARLALADDRLTVEVRDGRLLVEGKTSETALKARIQALAADLKATIPVEDRITYVGWNATPEGQGPLPIRIQSVMVGPPGYFTTDTGARYFVGGVIPDGAEVVAIDADEIQFKRSGQSIVYKLQDPRDSK